jgi:hypothetical protein
MEEIIKDELIENPGNEINLESEKKNCPQKKNFNYFFRNCNNCIISNRYYFWIKYT